MRLHAVHFEAMCTATVNLMPCSTIMRYLHSSITSYPVSGMLH